MQRALFIILLFLSLLGGHKSPFHDSAPAHAALLSSSDAQFAAAFHDRESNLQLQGKGIVVKVLRDDYEGSRHQRFLVRLDSGQTLLIAHNIDLAPRVSSLKKGDVIRFYGEYEWNKKGGVIHWTHRDPDGLHPAGWIEHKGRRYQ